MVDATVALENREMECNDLGDINCGAIFVSKMSPLSSEQYHYDGGIDC